MSHRCDRCWFWKYAPEEPNPWNGSSEKMGLCEEPSKAEQPRHLRLFGAGGVCFKFAAKETG